MDRRNTTCQPGLAAARIILLCVRNALRGHDVGVDAEEGLDVLDRTIQIVLGCDKRDTLVGIVIHSG